MQIYTENFGSWRELVAAAEDVAQRAGVNGAPDLLFRGQENSAWDIQSTLERSALNRNLISDYYRLIGVIKPQLETFTEQSWDDVDWTDLQFKFQSYDEVSQRPLPSYDYLVYLRHHGFPSPLVDWSRSLYVAAFFACREPLAGPPSERVAIFIYQAHTGGGKSGDSTSSQIFNLGPYVKSHRRHFLQQGQYTFAAKYKAVDGQNHAWHFAEHGEVFSTAPHTQDLIAKYTLPRSQCADVMRRLDDYNINAYSLFQSDETLLSMLAAREARRTT